MTWALVVVDVQNDFADARGSLAVADAADVIPVVNALVAETPVVVYSQDWHPPVTPHFATSGGTWPVHCVQATWGAELHPDLDVRGDVVRKGTGGEDGYSAFTVRDPTTGVATATTLTETLRAAHVTALVVVGLATDYCVRATALDGLALGWPVTVVRDAVRAVDLQPGDGDRALAELSAAGVVLQ